MWFTCRPQQKILEEMRAEHGMPEDASPAQVRLWVYCVSTSVSSCAGISISISMCEYVWCVGCLRLRQCVCTEWSSKIRMRKIDLQQSIASTCITDNTSRFRACHGVSALKFIPCHSFALSVPTCVIHVLFLLVHVFTQN